MHVKHAVLAAGLTLFSLSSNAVPSNSVLRSCGTTPASAQIGISWKIKEHGLRPNEVLIRVKITNRSKVAVKIPVGAMVAYLTIPGTDQIVSRPPANDLSLNTKEVNPGRTVSFTTSASTMGCDDEVLPRGRYSLVVVSRSASTHLASPPHPIRI